MQTKIDIISGFLGAGKTTLIKKLLEETFKDEKIALIENEFGTVGIDGALLKDYDIQIKELNAGCICCSIAGDFTQGLKEVLRLYKPDRIIIEPSGVSKLSDVIKGCKPFLKDEDIMLNLCITVLDVTKYKLYIKNFSEFYKDQLVYGQTILFSRTDKVSKEEIDNLLKDVRNYNQEAPIITTDWKLLEGKTILEAAIREKEGILPEVIKERYTGVKNKSVKLSNRRTNLVKSKEHHAEEVFQVWGIETSRIFEKTKIEAILNSLKNQEGFILRAKGMVETVNKEWLQFDYVPGEVTLKVCQPDYTGRICVIGSHIDKEKIAGLFGVRD